MQTKKIKAKKTRSAQSHLMSLLARRDHTELELRQKMRAQHSVQEIEAAIDKAREKKWLKSPEELSVLTYERLSRKGKSAFYIAQYLKKLGLPAAPRDDEKEYAKCLKVISPLLKKTDDKNKLIRFLQNRGFSSQIIRKVLKEHDYEQSHD